MAYFCLECHTPVGQGTGIDPYKHLVACYHLQDVGLDRVIRDFASRTDDYGRRVYEQALKAKEE